MSLSKTIVPKQKTGGHTGVTSTRRAASRREAVLWFNDCQTRLLDINGWKKLCGDRGAEFALTNERGLPIMSKDPEIGNLIRIRLPAPRNKVGDGFDWVRIEAFEHRKDVTVDEETFGFRVRPVQHPALTAPGSAHFYTSKASSTFLIVRHGVMLTVLERGRNEVPNPSGPLLQKLRNLLVAIPAMLGFSDPQWKLLVNGILAPPET